MSKLREIFSRKPEEMQRLVKWIFGIPLAYICYLAISLCIPSFGDGNNAQMLRMALLHVILAVCVLLIAKYFLKFKVIHFFYEDERFDWVQLFMAVGIIMFMNIVTSLIWHALAPQDFAFTFVLHDFAKNWICALVLVIAVAFSEEIIFRSYIAFFLHDHMETRPKYIYVYCVVSGLLFACSHFKNPEVQSNLLWAMVFYFIFGFALMFFSLATHGCEIAFGIHLGNNLVSAWFFSYDNSVIMTDALFTHHNCIGPMLIVQTVVCLLACSLLVRRYHSHKHGKTWKLT